MNSEESFKLFVINELSVKFVDNQNLKTLGINHHVEDWVESGYVEITRLNGYNHEIKLTELGKNLVLMGHL